MKAAALTHSPCPHIAHAVRAWGHAAIYYPTAVRSTGFGWAMGMGRVGSFVGPLAVGSLVAVGLSTAGIFVAIAVPALLAAATTAVVGLVKPA